MLAHRLRRRPDIKTALGQRLVFAGKCTWLNSHTATLTKCWASVVDGVPALKQCWLHLIVQRYSVCQVSLSLRHRPTQQHSADTWTDVKLMLVQRSSTVYNV